MTELPRQLVVVTGASSGIGLAMVRLLLDEGYSVLGIAKDFHSASIDHEHYTTHTLDMADLDNLPAAIGVIVRELEQSEMPIKALVNNAGIGKMGYLEQLSVEDIRLVMDTNFISHAIVTKTFLPLLKKQVQADILFTGSEAALKGARQGSVYCASKFAIRGFSQALREECGKSGVRVTLINPGAVRTPFFDELHFEPGAAQDNAIEPEDIAKVLISVIQARAGTVFDEITMSPLNHVWQRK